MTTKTIIILPNEQGKFILPISANLLREIGRTEVIEKAANDQKPA